VLHLRLVFVLVEGDVLVNNKTLVCVCECIHMYCVLKTIHCIKHSKAMVAKGDIMIFVKKIIGFFVTYCSRRLVNDILVDFSKTS
jgi:hypothetical protein